MADMMSTTIAEAFGSWAIVGADVLTYAIGGAVLGVWVEARQDVSLTWRWAARGLFMIAGSALAGVMLSAVVQALAAPFDSLSFVAAWPRWALAGAIAFCIRWAWPLIVTHAQRRWGAAAEGRAQPKQGGDTRA